jgi:sugar phosphate isomerase/epimerase
MTGRPASSPTGPETVVALSTASVYPETTATGFEMALRLGFDAVEVMVGIDETSQDIAQVRHLSEYHEMPVCAVHAPCLLITQRVWGTDPWDKLRRSAEMAHEVGADVVVVHPPFRWQRDYARGFVEGIATMEQETGLVFAVENMYPWRAPSSRQMQVYAPHWDPVDMGYAHTTLDVSHAATAQVDCLELAHQLGDSLRHVHLTDGMGSPKDEHLIPGRGTQPVAALLEHLAERDFDGHLVLEVNTRRSGNRAGREADLMEGLAFTRLHFAAAPSASSPVADPA